MKPMLQVVRSLGGRFPQVGVKALGKTAPFGQAQFLKRDSAANTPIS